MLTNRNKIVLLENEDQAKTFFKLREKFKDFYPISFNFNVEHFLTYKGIPFTKDEDYEADNFYNNIYKSSKKILDQFFREIGFHYQGVELLSLFYYDLCVFLSQSKKSLRLIRKIIWKEKPSEILLFKDSTLPLEEDFFYLVLTSFFKGKITVAGYHKTIKENLRDKFLVKSAGFLQQAFSKSMLYLSKSSNRNIMVFGGKIYFDSVIKLLSKKESFNVFNFDEILKKTFFVGPRLLPFYVFYGKNKKGCSKLSPKFEEINHEIESFFSHRLKSVESELVKPLIIKIKKLIGKEFPIISAKINEMFQVFENYHFKCLILSEDHSPFAKASIRVAKILKIPTFVFLHGLPVRDMNFGPFEPDFFLVYGEGIKEKYLENIPKSETKIEVIGCPRYDSFKSLKSDNKEKIILYPLDCSPESKIIPDRNITKRKQKKSLQMLFRTLKKFPEYNLVIKLKPNWDMAKLPLLVAKEENFNNFKIIDRADNLKLINNAKILIINHTTMGIEALLLGKPVISISFRELDSFSPYARIKLVQKVYNEKELEKAIKEAENHKQKHPFEHFLLTDRTASEKAVRLIKKIIST